MEKEGCDEGAGEDINPEETSGQPGGPQVKDQDGAYVERAQAIEARQPVGGHPSRLGTGGIPVSTDTHGAGQLLSAASGESEESD